MSCNCQSYDHDKGYVPCMCHEKVRTSPLDNATNPAIFASLHSKYDEHLQAMWDYSQLHGYPLFMTVVNPAPSSYSRRPLSAKTKHNFFSHNYLDDYHKNNIHHKYIKNFIKEKPFLKHSVIFAPELGGEKSKLHFNLVWIGSQFHDKYLIDDLLHSAFSHVCNNGKRQYHGVKTTKSNSSPHYAIKDIGYMSSKGFAVDVIKCKSEDYWTKKEARLIQKQNNALAELHNLDK